MFDPGWYHADGDRAGTTRYWDGATWVGAAVSQPPETAGGYDLIPPPQTAVSGSYGAAGVVASAQTQEAHKQAVAKVAATYQQPAVQFAHTGLRCLVFRVTGLKMIPFVLFAAGPWYVLPSGTDFDITPNGTLLDPSNLSFVMLIAVVAIAFALLAIQLVGALIENPLVILVPAAIMFIPDALLGLEAITSLLRLQGGIILSWRPIGAILFTVAMQARIVFWSFTMVMAK